MSDNSERSFGARLRKMQDAVEFIKKWSNWQPPRLNETVPELESLIAAITATNTAETVKQQYYTSVVKTRQDHYIIKDDSIIKLLVPIRAAVVANYGRIGTEAQQVGSFIKKMRDARLIKLPPDPVTGTNERTISQSEKSYGSMLQYFSDLVTTIDGFGGFTTSNNTISIASLKQKIQNTNTANNEVAGALQDVQTIRRTRNQLYNDLAERAKRIKDYAKSQYGAKSAEYLQLIAIGL